MAADDAAGAVFTYRAQATRSTRPGGHVPMVSDMIANGELDLDQAVAIQPIGRLGRADETASTVLWLCRPGASFVVGVALPVDGGYTAQ